MKHRLLRVVRRLFQYEALLTGGPPGGQGAEAGWGEQRGGTRGVAGETGLPLWLDGAGKVSQSCPPPLGRCQAPSPPPSSR